MYNTVYNIRGFMNRDLEFPVIYDLRVIYSGQGNEGIEKISKLLKDLTIDFRPGIIKPGGKGNLVRISFNVTIQNKSLMNTLYSNLNCIDGVKWAT